MRATWIVIASALIVSTAHAQDIGELVVVSTPSGAEIFVDGKSVGRSPAQVQLLPGDHVVQAKWDDGQQSTETTVAVELGKSNLVSFRTEGNGTPTTEPVQPVPPAAPAVAAPTSETVPVARAEAPATTTSVAPEPTSDSKLWLGGALELLPSGSITETQGGSSQNVGTVAAIGLGALIEYRVSPLISVGLAPRYVLNVETPFNPDSASMLDLRVRGVVRYEITPRIRMYGFGAFGYAMIFLPASAGVAASPAGLTLTFGGGATYAVNPRMYLSAELGYEFGFESTTVMATSISFNVNYLQLSGGIAIALGL